MAAFEASDFTSDFDITEVKRPRPRGSDYKTIQYATARPSKR